ncbi:MAG: NAD(P)/FAD-dependent oxidoreductase [Lachnospiraceae bacterium]|nr:NAD(P)/FAD-dependent oxidoreductase [Lachnospiraceae bacterium]
MNSDVIIIGAGVTGCAIARYLTRYDVSVMVLERNEDVCTGTSKANSGICHAGFDAKEGSLKAKLNVSGNKMMEALSRELDFPFIRNGSLVLCEKEEDMPRLQELLERGKKNGVENLEIIDRSTLEKLEPNITRCAVGALYAKDGGIVDPFMLTIALGENAADNGAKFIFNSEVTDIEKSSGGYIVKTTEGNYEAKIVINAAGVYADKIHNMVSEDKMHIVERRGEYFLLDKSAGSYVKSTIFALPTALGKGILVSPTTHGNLIVGPTANDIEDKDDTATTAAGLQEIRDMVDKRVVNCPLNQVITSFSGLRAHGDRGDFIIEEVKDAPHFIDVAGIESPGLTSAPAIGVMVSDMVRDMLSLKENAKFDPKRNGILHPFTMSDEERDKLIKEKPSYSSIVCRCEMITEGEIIDALTRTLPAKSLDGVKRRVRAGMGRCQAGFCSPRVMELICKYTGCSMEEVTKFGGASRQILGTIKEEI